MKRLYLLLALALIFLPVSGCQTAKKVTDSVMQSDLVGMVGQMTGNETLALFTTENVSMLGEHAVAHADSVQQVAPPESKYSRRIDSLAAELVQSRALTGANLNFKVYLADQMNAFATPDGSIRIFSGLMDELDDGELKFVMGHEAGHVVHGHSREKMMVSIGLKSARDLMADQGGAIEDFASGQAGEIASGLASAQFSQKEENEADDFALEFMADQGYDVRKVPSALMKLANPDQTQSGLQSMLASHPAPQERAQRMQTQLQSNEDYAKIAAYHEQFDGQDPSGTVEEGNPTEDEGETSEGDGTSVADVQVRLNARGYNCGPSDGVMGPTTRRCIRAFQRANGLKQTGEMNQVTRKMLRRVERQ